MYLRLIIVLVLFVNTSWAQDKLSFKEVEQKTYGFYKTAQWDSLLIVGNDALKIGIDYYYLNIRMAIASYNTASNYNTIKHAKKALEKDPTAELPHLYLYWAYLNINELNSAKKQFDELSDSTKSKYSFKFKKPLSVITPNLGLKISNNRDEFKPMRIATLGLGGRLNSKLSWYNNSTVIGQSLLWGSYLQFGNYLGLTYDLGKQFRISAYANYLGLSGDISSSLVTQNVNTIPMNGGFPSVVSENTVTNTQTWDGTLTQQALATGVGFEKRIRSNVFYLGGSYLNYQTWINYSQTDKIENTTRIKAPDGNILNEFTNTVVNTKNTKTDSVLEQFQLDFGYQKTSVLNEKLKCGLNLYLPFTTEKSHAAWDFSTSYQVTPKTNLLLGYYQSSTEYALQNRGALLVNTGEVLKSKIFFQSNIKIKDHINWSLYVANESYSGDLNYFSILKGLNFKIK